MSERWRKPVIPLAVEQETRFVMRQSGIAAPIEMFQLVLEEEDVKRIANGQVCFHCQEPFETPYPEKCPVCEYPSRKLQALHFHQFYMGKEKSLTPMEDHLVRFHEEDARKVHEPGKQILVPRGFDSKA